MVENIERSITIDLMNTESLHEFYMLIVKLEREGFPYVDEVIKHNGSYLTLRVSTTQSAQEAMCRNSMVQIY